MTSTPSVEPVSEIIEGLERIVAREGGRIALHAISEDGGTVTVKFQEGTNEECKTCLVDRELVHAFLIEGLRTRGLAVEAVHIEPFEEALS